jgi:hypothetical protein
MSMSTCCFIAQGFVTSYLVGSSVSSFDIYQCIIFSSFSLSSGSGKMMLIWL